jgi:2-succinyl-6-hydroxy-2,4-cyclohexadiene-1-carboxylate synthase
MKTSTPCLKGTYETGRFLISYRIYGDKGPQLICINGVQQSMAMWQTFVTRFSRDYTIVLFDFPNQGKAKIVSGPPQVSLDEQVEILSAMMDKMGLSPATTICAASWGGVIAVAFASKYRDRVNRLILASLGTKPNKKMVETIKKGANLDMSDRGKMAETLIESFGGSLPEQFKQNIIKQFHAMKEESVQAFYEHGLFVISSKRLGDMVDLRAIKAKTILLNGENDTIIDLEDVAFLASQIPDCELKIVKDVGHFLHMEREEVLDIYEDILPLR